MKILIASRGIPSKKDPQFGSFAMDQAKALRAAGHDVAIMSVDGLIGKHFKRPGISSWVQDDIKCFEIFGMPLAIVKDYVSKSLGIDLERWTTRKLYDAVLKKFGKPDIVHSHFLL